MLMTGSGKAARIHYLAGHVPAAVRRRPCRVRGDRRRAFRSHELRYWSVERQEPYVDAAASLKAEQARRSRSALTRRSANPSHARQISLLQ